MYMLRLFTFTLTLFGGAVAVADVNSGCPSWGCLPQGTFSFSAGIPSSNGRLKWSSQVDALDGSVDVLNLQGCVSDQLAVVCSSTKGYVSVDPTNGKVLWNYTTKAPPYLPVMDTFGDVIGMDTESLYYVGADGQPKTPIDISILQPAFSLMVANDSILFLTSTQTTTAQVVSYGTDGVVDASITLTGVVERVNGTFVPCSQPVISGFRVYLLTQFVPTDLDSEKAQEVLGMQRLYAMDLRARLIGRIEVIWYANLEMEGNSLSKRRWARYSSEGIQPIVMFYRGAVYINNAGPMTDGEQRDKQPYPTTLWAYRDMGNDTKLLFRRSCSYGAMAAYDKYDKPLEDKNDKEEIPASSTRLEEEDGIIWVLNPSPAFISAHSAKNGSIIGQIDLAKFSNVSVWASSKLSVTRQPGTAQCDILVVGMTAESGEAYIVAVSADRNSPTSNTSLVLSVKVGSDKIQGQTTESSKVHKPDSERAETRSITSRYSIAGQIVNVANQKNKWGFHSQSQPRNSSKEKISSGWELGIVALVAETSSEGSKLHAVAVF